jgi:hypothetical protein
VHCPWTTTRRLRVWVCWQSLQVKDTGSFLVFNRACLLASACPTRAIPAFGSAYCLSPRWYMSMESHSGMILTRENQLTQSSVIYFMCVFIYIYTHTFTLLSAKLIKESLKTVFEVGFLLLSSCIHSEGANVCLLTLPCLSVFPYFATQESLSKFLWNFILGIFIKNCLHIPLLLKIKQQ